MISLAIFRSLKVLALLLALLHLSCRTTRYSDLNEEGASSQGFKIAHLYVSHGEAAFLFFPNGKIMLLDTAQHGFADKYVLPFIEKQGIKTIDYLVISHQHGDHNGGWSYNGSTGPLKKLKEDGKIAIKEVWINHHDDPIDLLAKFAQGDFGGVKVEILNWHKDRVFEDSCKAYMPSCLNQMSLSLRFEYKGFVYASGGDIYQQQQENILSKKPSLVEAHVYRTNHHMHGGASMNYFKKSDAAVYITSGDEETKKRDAYKDFLRTTDEMKRSGKRFVKSYLTEDDGHVVITATGKDSWTHKNYADSGSEHVKSLGDIPMLQGPTQGSGQGADQGRGQGADQGRGQGTDQGKGQGTDQGKGQGTDQGKGQGTDQGRGQGTDQGQGSRQDQTKQRSDPDSTDSTGGYPPCGATSYGIEFQCGDKRCKKSDPEYKNFCRIN